MYRTNEALCLTSLREARIILSEQKNIQIAQFPFVALISTKPLHPCEIISSSTFRGDKDHMQDLQSERARC